MFCFVALTRLKYVYINDVPILIFQDKLGEIVFVQLPDIGAVLEADGMYKRIIVSLGLVQKCLIYVIINATENCKNC